MSGGHWLCADRNGVKTVACMTVYESFMIILGVIDALIALGMLLIALLNFLQKRKDSQK